jgi:hypothetical protein
MSAIGEPASEHGRRAPVDHRRVRRAPAAKPPAHGPKFFMPGEEDGRVETESSYAALREAVRAETSLTPRARRIFSISCRLHGRECTFEVGQPSPSGAGSVVLAILDVGGDQPYSVRMTDGEPSIRLGRRLYSITEFRP